MNNVFKKSYSGIANYLDYLIYIFLCCYLIIDSITGFLLLSGGASISTAYKVFLLILMILSVSLKKMDIICYIIFIFLLMLICLFNHLDNITGKLIDSFSSILRLITNQVFFIYFYYILKSNDKLEKYSSNKFFKINLFIFLCNIIIGILGFGFYTYPSLNVGIKGFFYAGNQVSVLFYCLYYIILVKLKTQSNKILFLYIIALIISILIATKVSVFSCIVISGIDYYFRSTQKRKFYIKLFFPILIGILIGLGAFLLPKTEFYQRVEFVVTRSLGQGYNFLEAILSGRLTFLRNNYKTWMNYLSPIVFLFGFGTMPRIVEIDFFDTLFHVGIFFTVSMLAFYFFLICLSIKSKNYRLFFFNLIYLSISFIAGHVWENVMVGLFYAYINAYELLYYKNHLI